MPSVPQKRWTLELPTESKLCRRCNKYLSKSEFSKNSKARDKLSGECKQCAKARFDARATVEYREQHRIKIRNRIRFNKYGITPEDVDALLVSQGGGCGICGGTSGEKSTFHVDHDHDTGVVRGILCGGCNIALGGMKDSPAILRAAADYLERHGK